jgi:effector-binding domain-containing protein
MNKIDEKLSQQIPLQDNPTEELQGMVEPRIEARAERSYIAIPIEATLKEWDKVNALIEELFGWLKKKGLQPNGAPFFRYRVIGDRNKKFKLEVGIPVVNATFGDERVVAGTTPEGKYVIIDHKGHPDYIHETINMLEKWSENRGLTWDKKVENNEEVWGGRFEYYLTDPAIEHDLEKWSIEIAFKVKEGSKCL